MIPDRMRTARARAGENRSSGSVGAPTTAPGGKGRIPFRSPRPSGTDRRSSRVAEQLPRPRQEPPQPRAFVHPLGEAEGRHRERRDALRAAIGAEHLALEQGLGPFEESLGGALGPVPQLEERETYGPALVEHRVGCRTKGIRRARHHHRPRRPHGPPARGYPERASPRRGAGSSESSSVRERIERTSTRSVASTVERDVRFKRMVRPGEKLIMEVELTERLADAFFLKAKATVDGKVAAWFEFACTAARRE